MDRLAFAWECHGNSVERVHDDGHHSSAGFASSIGGALDKVIVACSLVGLVVTSVIISMEEENGSEWIACSMASKSLCPGREMTNRGLCNGAGGR